MASQWFAFCLAEAWYAPIEKRNEETILRVFDLATPDAELLGRPITPAAAAKPAPVAKSCGLPPPSALTPAR
jgi:hypothetical protein